MLILDTCNRLMVKPERRRPLPPKVGRVRSIAQRSQPSLGRTCVDLVLHRPGARPNRLRCATQVDGPDILSGLCFRLGRLSAGVLIAVGTHAIYGQVYQLNSCDARKF